MVRGEDESSQFGQWAVNLACPDYVFFEVVVMEVLSVSWCLVAHTHTHTKTYLRYFPMFNVEENIPA